MEDQGLSRRVLDGVQPEEDHQVVAGVDLAVDGAVEPRQAVVEGHRTVAARAHRDAGEALVDRTGELAADVAVVLGQHGDSQVFPAAVPTIFTGIRISGAAAILVLIAAELIGATAGLGFLINYAQFNFLIPKMYAAILTTSALGLAINYALVGLERHFSRWRT